VVCPGTANFEGIESDLAGSISATAGVTYTLSAAIYRTTGTAMDFRSDIRAVGGDATSTVIGGSTGPWFTASHTFTPTTTGTYSYAIRHGAVTAADTFYVDAVLVEAAATAGSYFDGSFTNAVWLGTANASRSRLTVLAVQAVTANRALVYNIVQAITATRAINYNIVNAVTANRSLVYTIVQAITANRSLVYNIFRAITANRAITYNIKNSVTADRALVYTIIQAITANRALVYTIVQAIPANRSLVYNVYQAIPANRALVYNIQNSVSANRALVYNIYQAIAANRALVYTIVQAIGADRSLVYTIDGAPPLALFTELMRTRQLYQPDVPTVHD